MADSPLATWLRGQDPASAPDDPPIAPPWDLDHQPGRSRRRLLLLVAAPWVAAAVLGAAVLGSDGRAATPPVQPTASAEPAPAPSVATEGLAEVGALAVRAGVSGSPGGDPPRTRYVDGAVGIAVRAVGDAAVVTVLALVLEGGADGWQKAALERYAVAVRTSAHGPVAVAGPWALPAPAQAASVAGAEPVTDAVLREKVAATLAAVGYRDVAALDLYRDAALPGVLLARIEAVAPGSQVAGTATAWLRDTPDPQLIGGEP